MEDIGFVIFSFFNVIWATLYLESWKRRSAELSYQWGTIDTKGEMLSEPRVQYQVYISDLNDKICRIGFKICIFILIDYKNKIQLKTHLIQIVSY